MEKKPVYRSSDCKAVPTVYIREEDVFRPIVKYVKGKYEYTPSQKYYEHVAKLKKVS